MLTFTTRLFTQKISVKIPIGSRSLDGLEIAAMNEDTWKQYEQNLVTHSAAHHLSAIADLHAQHGYARVSDVARALNITRGSASLTLKALKHRGWVEEDENRFLRLSEQGRAIVSAVKSKSVLIRNFFSNVLGLSVERAEIDTCKIEHLISNETAVRLGQFVLSLGNRSSDVLQQLVNVDCGHDPGQCPVCEEKCLLSVLVS